MDNPEFWTSTLPNFLLSKEFWKIILPTYLTAIGTVGAVLWALIEAKKTRKDAIRLEKRRANKTLKLFDSLTKEEREVFERFSKTVDEKIDVEKIEDGTQIGEKEISREERLSITREIGELHNLMLARSLSAHIQRYLDEINTLLPNYHTLLNEESLDYISDRTSDCSSFNDCSFDLSQSAGAFHVSLANEPIIRLSNNAIKVIKINKRLKQSFL